MANGGHHSRSRLIATIAVPAVVLVALGSGLLASETAPAGDQSEQGIAATGQVVDCAKARWLASVLRMEGSSGHLSPAAVATLRNPDVHELFLARHTSLFASMSRALIHGGNNPLTGYSAAFEGACVSLVNAVERS